MPAKHSPIVNFSPTSLDLLKMIDPHDFARKQSELAAEFAKYILDHPEIDDSLPEDSQIYFEIADDTEFNEYSQELAFRRRDEEDANIVCVRVQGLEPQQGSRLIDPQITATPHVA